MSLVFLHVTPILLALCLLYSWLLYHSLCQQGRPLRLEPIEAQLSPSDRLLFDARSDAVSSHLTAVTTSETSSGERRVDIGTVPAKTPSPPPEGRLELTIGMATYNDFDGVYFTLQALRLYQDLERTELLVIDNYGCPDTKALVEGWENGRYIRATEVVGTAAPRDLVFREARGQAVLCCDCHILFPPGVIARLKQFYREHPDCQDLLQGPLLYDHTNEIATHFDPIWKGQIWGTWGSDPRGLDPEGEPFEIPMQGLGVFSCRKQACIGKRGSHEFYLAGCIAFARTPGAGRLATLSTDEPPGTFLAAPGGTGSRVHFHRDFPARYDRAYGPHRA